MPDFVAFQEGAFDSRPSAVPSQLPNRCTVIRQFRLPDGCNPEAVRLDALVGFSCSHPVRHSSPMAVNSIRFSGPMSEMRISHLYQPLMLRIFCRRVAWQRREQIAAAFLAEADNHSMPRGNHNPDA